VRPRFLAFASRPEEAGDWQRRLPDVDLSFAGHAIFQPGVLAFRPEDPEVFLQALAVEHRRRPFSGLVNRREKYVVPACLAARELALAPPALRAEPVRDKLAMRRALGGEVILVREPPLDVPVRLFPAILKPRFGFNSRGVVRVEGPSDLARQLRRQRAFFAHLRRPDSASLDFVVEPWFPGTEHTAETLVREGRVEWCLVSDKMPMLPPFHVEVGDLAPSRLSPEGHQQVCAAVREAVARLGIWTGWAHVEVKLDGGRAVVIEAAARMGGGCHEELNQEVYGLDRVRVLANLQLGGPLPEPPAPRAWAAVSRAVVNGIGYVRVPRRLRERVEAEGARLLWPQEHASRLVIGPPFGYKNTVYEVMACHADPDHALRRVANVQARVRLRRLPVPAPLFFALRRLVRGRAPLDG